MDKLVNNYKKNLPKTNLLKIDFTLYDRDFIISLGEQLEENKQSIINLINHIKELEERMRFLNK